MSFWSGIKHALNSTLGTEQFQPLDEIVTKQWTIIASDDVYEDIGAGITITLDPDTGFADYTFPALTMTKYGTIRIAATLTPGVVGGFHENDVVYLSVTKNGNTIYESTKQNAPMTINTDIDVFPGDTILIYMSYKGRTGYADTLSCSECKICGTLKNSFYTKEETE